MCTYLPCFGIKCPLCLFQYEAKGRIKPDINFFLETGFVSLNHRKYLNMRDKIKARTIYMNSVKKFNC